MKKLYTLLCFLAFMFISQKDWGQCTCTDGSIPDSISYHQYFDSIVSTNTTISFPQFNPLVGTLMCFKLSDTVTTIVDYNLQNNQPINETYGFTTSRLSEFDGPNGFDQTVSSNNKHYGPYALTAKDSIGDSVNIGPDTTFLNKYDQSYGSPGSGYYGTGTVAFNYLNTSTFAITTGSTNAIFTLMGFTRLNVALTYYWCPSSVLATQLLSFAATPQNKSVWISWRVDNPAATDSYQLEMSADGSTFIPLGPAAMSLSGGVATYGERYTPAAGFSGVLFFRIRQTDASGRLTFSPIRTAAMGKGALVSYNLYPNPSVTGISIQILQPGGGNFDVQLIDAYGQVNFRKTYSVAQNGAIRLEWTHKPAPGTYFVKVTDLTGGTDQVQPIQIL